MKANWFEKLFGFYETTDNVYQNLHVVYDGDTRILESSVNGRRFRVGDLAITNYNCIDYTAIQSGAIQVRNIVGEVTDLLCDPVNNGAIFQVASQFNLLEMPSPSVSPESGITNYEFDNTQGPACAVAAAASTMYRNYFVFDDAHGQTSTRQINTIGKLLAHLGIADKVEMSNGYLLIDVFSTLYWTSRALYLATDVEYEHLLSLIDVGVHSNVEVTLESAPENQLVTQVFCSAVPISQHATHRSACWKPLATLILEAAYKTTLAVAAKQMKDGGSNVVYLTLVGGGAFGNPPEVIAAAIRSAVDMFKDIPLDVRIVTGVSDVPTYLKLLVAEF